MSIDWKHVAQSKVATKLPVEAAQIIREILTAESEYEQWLHRDLLLAGWCLTQASGELQGADPELVDEVLDRLITILSTNPLQIGRSVRAISKEILCSLDASTLGRSVLDRLSLLEKQIDLCDLVEYQIILGDIELGLSQLDQLLEGKQGYLSDKLKAVEILLKLSNERSLISQSAAAQKLVKLLADDYSELFIEALGDLGEISPEVINALFAIFEHKPSSNMEYAAKALVKLGQSDPHILYRLLELAKHPNWRIRRYVAGWSDQSSQIIFPYLIQVLTALTEDEHPVVRYCATASLGELINNAPEVIPQLLKLTNDHNEDVCSYAIYAFGKLEEIPSEILDQLILLATEEAQRSCVAYVLGSMTCNKERVIRQLLVFMIDNDPHTVNVAIESLVKINAVTPEIVAAVIRLLDHNEIWLRSSAAWALGNLGCATPEIIQTLKVRLHQNDNTFTRAAAESLIKLGHSSIDIANEAIAFLEHESFSLRESIAADFSRLGKQSKDLEHVLVEWLKKHPEKDAVRDAVDALWSIVVE
jgi:HEAT repeat protein